MRTPFPFLKILSSSMSRWWSWQSWWSWSSRWWGRTSFPICHLLPGSSVDLRDLLHPVPPKHLLILFSSFWGPQGPLGTSSGPKALSLAIASTWALRDYYVQDLDLWKPHFDTAGIQMMLWNETWVKVHPLVGAAASVSPEMYESKSCWTSKYYAGVAKFCKKAFLFLE